MSAFPTPATPNLQEIVLLRGPATEWLRGHMPEYLNLDMKRGTHAAFSQRKASEFIDHFGLGSQRQGDGSTHNPLEGLLLHTGPDTTGALQEAITRWFLNNAKAHRANKTKIAPSLISFAPPSKKSHAKSVFAQAHSSELKTRMNAKVRALELPTQNNLPFWYEALNELWDLETPEEQAEWHRKAAEQNKQVPGEASVAEIDSNQELAPIGQAVFHLQGAMLGQGDVIRTFSCCIGPPGAEELESYYSEYDSHLSHPFVDWAHHVLSPVATPHVDGVTVNPNGTPVMPDLDTEELSNVQFTQLLEEYLVHAWRFAHAVVGAATVPPIPWTNITSSPDQFVHPSRFPKNITFRKPSDMLGAHRQLLYLHIIEHQDPLDELHQFEFTPISEIEEIPEYEIETPGHTIHADGQMPTLPMETLASDLRMTYVVTNVAQYDEIPPPNTLEAQPEETAEPVATLEMLPQDNLEDPAHPLDVVQQHPPHDPEMGLPGLSTFPAQRPSAFPLTGDLEP
ncbi:hypothetical protein JB92DRAFT_3141474 [Gautieria morchelliformis]|nr:hypothetical protein JB92DRAFT_3141474 [Gautieria morchelliformis]